MPAKDVEGLTAALMEMVEDEELRRRCGDAALETARDYTMAAIGPKWDEMLQALVARARPARRLAQPSPGRRVRIPVRRLTLLLLTLLLAATAAPATADAAARGQCLLRKSGPQCYVWTGKVTFIADGDTVYVDIDGDGSQPPFPVRITGINAMEQTTYTSRAARAPRRVPRASRPPRGSSSC